MKNSSDKKAPKTVRACEIVSKLQDAEGNSLFDMDVLPRILAQKATAVKDYAYIIHDQDTYTATDEEANPAHKAGAIKPAHIHLLMRFERNQPQQFDSIAGWFGLEAQFVSKIKGKWQDAVLYLIHANAPEKFQYDANDVIANFNIQTTVDHAKDQQKLDAILSSILTGDIREYNKTLKIDNLTLVYHAKEINEAFRIRSAHLQATQQSRNTEVVFITGESGTGKTTLAKRIAKERGLDYFVSSGSNDVMDGYGQQPCLILDDIRPSSLGLSDLLKLLDNHTASSIKSRYKNKYLNCDLIILTTVLDLDTFYNNVFEREQEAVTQLKRRCGTYIQVFRDYIAISRWDRATMHYSTPQLFKNDIISEYVAEKPKTAEVVEQEISNLLPFLTPEPVPKSIHDLVHRATSSPSTKSEIISDEEFAALMPRSKKEEPMDENGLS